MNKKRIVLIIVGVFVLAVVIGAISSSGHSSSQSSQGNQNNQVSQGSGSSVSQWASNNASDLQTLGTDLTTTGQDASASNVDTSVVSSDCQALENDVTTLQNDGPIPDSSLESTWSQVLSSINSGAQDCVSGISQNDPNLIQQATTEFNNANTLLNNLVPAITG